MPAMSGYILGWVSVFLRILHYSLHQHALKLENLNFGCSTEEKNIKSNRLFDLCMYI